MKGFVNVAQNRCAKLHNNNNITGFWGPPKEENRKITEMESELFKTFACHGGIVLLKTIIMSPLTGMNRMKNSVRNMNF